MMDEKKDVLWRVYLLYGFMLIFGITIIARIVYIQVKYGDELREKAQKQEIRVFDVEALRGNILADDGSLLATSVPVFEVRMDVASPLIDQPFFDAKVDSLALMLSRLFKDRSRQSYLNQLKRARKQGNRYFQLQNRATYSQVKQLRTFPILRRGKYKGGLILIPHDKREKPFRELASRTIGYQNEQEELFVGIEGAYHHVLKGIDGKQVKRRINNGDWKPLFDGNEIEPQNGKDVVTTIDINIQDVAEDALRRNLQKNNAEEGCAILMEVATGKIKAIANLSINAKTGRYEETYNYALAESVEPGSTFKLASMIALLEDKKVRLSDTMDVGRSGYIVYYNRTMRDVYPIRNGRFTVREAFEKSSNVAISKLVWDAYKDKPEQFVEHLYDMSLNQPLGLEIQGEGKPYIKHPRDKKLWYGTTLPWMSIGYELSLTPLQILTFYNAVANNGRMVKPIFVEEIRQGGRTIERFETQLINKSIASQATIDSVKSLMEGVVERGTARYLNNSPFKIAGKTGTAQIASGSQGYNKTNYTASFVGYFPAATPRYSCIVVVSNPSSGKIYGGAVAAPVFKEIADKVYATRLDIHEEQPLIDKSHAVQAFQEKVINKEDATKLSKLLGLSLSDQATQQDWVSAKADTSLLLLQPAKISPEEIPDVRGMNVRDAVFLLENMGLKVLVNGHGQVAWQSVRPGTPPTKNREVELKLVNL
ncbi:MAG: transpeptidase family protein [Bacteroidales bacterium]|jgi:cell division protein FtsI (penicillin-binding protein 3)|nr:transpeptidase family protein [Bacteroidales bacterium]